MTSINVSIRGRVPVSDKDAVLSHRPHAVVLTRLFPLAMVLDRSKGLAGRCLPLLGALGAVGSGSRFIS